MNLINVIDFLDWLPMRMFFVKTTELFQTYHDNGVFQIPLEFNIFDFFF